MDRQIVYPGAIPLETDLLNTNKFAMIGLAKLASAIMGNNTYLQGLECLPTSPSSMAIHIAEGQIYSLQNMDGSPYSSLAADTTHTLLKQGLSPETLSFTLSAPDTTGHSINYLIQVAYSDVDNGAVILPYYNAANPAIAFSGPNNEGTAQSTVRSGVCHVKLKAGQAAITGKQATPAPDNGFIAAWVITVNQGASSIEQGSIRPADGAPFLPREGLVSAIQRGELVTGVDVGGSDNYCVRYHPAITAFTEGMRLFFRTQQANAGACTLKVNDLPEKNILTAAGEQPGKGLINVNQLVEVEWNTSLDCWILRHLASGYSKRESDGRYLPVAGGHIEGDLAVNGQLSTAHPLHVGEAELCLTGDIKGGAWGGSLQQWMLKRQPRMMGLPGKLCWKDPITRFIAQGDHVERSELHGNIYFHLAFPKVCLSIVITQTGKTGVSRDNACVIDVTNQSFRIAAGKGETSFYWMAFGY